MTVDAIRDFKTLNEKAKEMSKEFTNLTGIDLKFNHFYIDSPQYGYIDELDDFPEDDPDSVIVFEFDETDNNYETVCFVPTLDTAMVWRSLADGNPYWNVDDDCSEGAVDPNTGNTHFADGLFDNLYPLSDWKNYKRKKVAV